MKLKYYLRGVGTGILFATIILFISYSYKMSDGQIKKRAEELGMVMSTEEQSSSNIADNSTVESDESTSGDEPTSEEPTSEETSSEEPSSEEPSTEEPSTEEPSSEESTTNPNEKVTCTITVTNRTGSDDVAYLLAQAGIIEDAEDFNDYLINNGYAYRIQNGTFTFEKGMTYNEMAEYLATGRY